MKALSFCSFCVEVGLNLSTTSLFSYIFYTKKWWKANKPVSWGGVTSVLIVLLEMLYKLRLLNTVKSCSVNLVSTDRYAISCLLHCEYIIYPHRAVGRHVLYLYSNKWKEIVGESHENRFQPETTKREILFCIKMHIYSVLNLHKNTIITYKYYA